MIKPLTPRDLDHALRSAPFAPIAVPVANPGILGRSLPATAINLSQILPAGDAQSGGKNRDALFGGITGGLLQTQGEANTATLPPLRFQFQSFDVFKPLTRQIITINARNAELVGKELIFLLAQQIF